MSKKFSIITIVLNDREGLRKTMQSVFSQTYSDFEYIIIDGGSTDGSVDEIKNNEGKIDKWISENDSGIYNAMNKGIERANGEYLLFLNSGDYLVNERVLQNVYEQNRQEDIVYGAIYFSDKSKLKYAPQPSSFKIIYLILGTVYHPSAFIRRTVFDKTGMYDESYKIAGDYDFFLKALVKLKVSSCYLSFPISVFNMEGISNNKKSKENELFERKKICEKYFTNKQLEDARKYSELVNGIPYRFIHYIERKLEIRNLTKKIFNINYY